MHDPRIGIIETETRHLTRSCFEIVNVIGVLVDRTAHWDTLGHCRAAAHMIIGQRCATQVASALSDRHSTRSSNGLQDPGPHVFINRLTSCHVSHRILEIQDAELSELGHLRFAKEVRKHRFCKSLRSVTIIKKDVLQLQDLVELFEKACLLGLRCKFMTSAVIGRRDESFVNHAKVKVLT